MPARHAAQSIPGALAALNENHLAGLHRAIAGSNAMPPGLMAYLEHAIDDECARREGRTYPLREPRDAIPHEELGATFATVAALMLQFTTHPRVRALIEAIGDDLVARPPEVLH